MAEFAANNHVSETTGISPFFTNYGLNPKIDFEPDLWVNNPEENEAYTLADRLSEIHDLIKSEMSFAQDWQQEYANWHHLPAPAYRPGDSVWLNGWNLCMNCPSQKLDDKYYGLFSVITEVGKYAYELNLPATMDVHPVFHVSLLEPVCDDSFPGQVGIPPSPIIIEGEPEYEVEDVLNSRMFWCWLQSLIKWRGWDILTWEYAIGMNKLRAIEEFHTQYPNKPGPLLEDTDWASVVLSPRGGILSWLDPPLNC
jgi:hypothetical protein